MGGMKRCPNCNHYMFIRTDYSLAIPDLYHYCEHCGYTDREQESYYTSTITNFIKNNITNNRTE